MMRVLLLGAALGLPLSSLAAEPVETRLLHLAQILVDRYPDADPMVVAHARDLIAGQPVKRWKNCLIEKALVQAQRAGQTPAASPLARR